ncbi:MAG: hypothetical protein DRN08_03030 [Thermoplasmata archaeon]|nr:MAG: hypothetical protein DRN08_03030 [Thermoplasmata archaeon]
MPCLKTKTKTSLMGMAMILISYGIGTLKAGDPTGFICIILGIVIIALKYHYNIPNNENNPNSKNKGGKQ